MIIPPPIPNSAPKNPASIAAAKAAAMNPTVTKTNAKLTYPVSTLVLTHPS